MRNEIEARLRADALADPAFREALVADAATAIAERYGVSTPSGVAIRAIAEAPDEVVLVLPAAGPVALDEASLDAVAGAGYVDDPNDDGEGTG